MRSGLFDSKAIVDTVEGYPKGDRAEDAQFFAKYFSAFIGNGIYPNPSTNFQVLAYDQMTVRVYPGLCFINGYFGWDEDFSSITFNSDTVPHTYRVILRLSLTTRYITLETLTDNFALTRNDAVWDLALADISVRANQITINQTNITDLRLNGNLCGIVHGVVDQLDTTTLGNQLNGWIESYKEQTIADYEEFLEFLANLKELSTTAYNNLIEYFNSLKIQANENYQILLDHFSYLRDDADEHHQALLEYLNSLRKNADNKYSLLVAYFEQLKEDGNEQYENLFDFFDGLKTQGDKEYQKFLIWLEDYKDRSSNEFQTWFDSIKGILGSDEAGNLLLLIQELQSQQPTQHIGTITHTLDKYPQCDLYSYGHGFGVGRFGDGPFGSDALVTIPAKFTLADKSHVAVATIPEFKTDAKVVKMDKSMFALTYPDSEKNLLLILR